MEQDYQKMVLLIGKTSSEETIGLYRIHGPKKSQSEFIPHNMKWIHIDFDMQGMTPHLRQMERTLDIGKSK